jgi:ribosomal protein S18 acetylase RimI-like enzyme
MLVDVRANGPAANTESRLGRLIAACRSLGESTFWGNNVLDGVSKKGAWKLNILAQDVFLCGFVVYRFDASREKVEVAYLAVSPALRGQGIGRSLIRWVQNYAQTAITRSRASVVCCSCVPESIGFYQRLGFRRTKPVEAKDEDEAQMLIPGQFLMLWKIPPPSIKAKK